MACAMPWWPSFAPLGAELFNGVGHPDGAWDDFSHASAVSWSTYSAPRGMGRPRLRAAGTSFAGGEHPVMIVSGMTAKKEMCLVVGHGHVGAEGNDVSLEECEVAVRQGDGREVWHFDSKGRIHDEMGGKCITWDQDANEGQGRMVMSDCDKSFERNDGRSQWEPTPTNQVRSAAQPGDLCISLSGDGASAVEVNAASGADTKATSTFDDVSHSSGRAVDGDSSSYWASGPLREGQEVTYQVNFPSEKEVNSVEIQWEFPPKSFKLEISEDGEHWIKAYEVSGNPRHSAKSKITLQGQWANHLRVVMTKPDLLKGMFQGNAYFGIRSIKAFAPSHYPVLEPCSEAARHPGAADKWFLTSVQEFDPGKAAIKRNEAYVQKQGSREFIDATWVLPKRRKRVSQFISFTNADPTGPAAGLRSLALHRQQHRRTLDGFLCAAASVQNRAAFTGCTDMKTPDGESGHDWCYLEPQIIAGLPSGAKRWGDCAKLVDYDKIRRESEYL